MNTAANNLQTSHNAEVLPSITRRKIKSNPNPNHLLLSYKKHCRNDFKKVRKAYLALISYLVQPSYMLPAHPGQLIYALQTILMCKKIPCHMRECISCRTSYLKSWRQ